MSAFHRTNWHGYRVGTYVCLALLAVALVVVALMGAWQGTVVLVEFFLITFVLLLDDWLPGLFTLLFVVAALIKAAGWMWGLSDGTGRYDLIAQSFTIFSVTLTLGYRTYKPLLDVFHEHRRLFCLTMASFGIAIGVLWAVVEWQVITRVAGDVVTSRSALAQDVIMSAIGAALAGLFSLWALAEHARAGIRRA